MRGNYPLATRVIKSSTNEAVLHHYALAIPVGELLRLLFSFRAPVENRPAAVIYGAYFDESDEKPGFGVAGYSASYETWVHLGWKWTDLLKKWNLEYYKASENENALGQFAQCREDPKNVKTPLNKAERARLKEIKTEFIDAICSHHDDLQGYGAVVVQEDFARLVREDEAALSLLTESPYYICFQLCLVAAALPARNANERRTDEEKIYIKPIFDSHKEYSRVAKTLFDKFAPKNPKSAEVLVPPSFDDDKTTTPLQVADTLAYETRKLFNLRIQKPEDDYMRVPMIRLKPNVYRLYELDYKTLKALLARQTGDSIAVKPANISGLL